MRAGALLWTSSPDRQVNDPFMEHRIRTNVRVAAAILLVMLAADRAEAFRCGSKLVNDGMHEQQVIAICGEPATSRHLGFAVRGYDSRMRRQPGSGWAIHHDRGYSQLSEEVVIVEYVYNFGPRKLMQRLLFEGGILVTIEPLGYGYRTR